MDDLENELKENFLSESLQLLEESEQLFLSLETNRDDPELINNIFRLAHNLKGDSRAVGFGDVAEFTHELENLILKIKEGQIPPTDNVVTTLLECNDHLGSMIRGLESDMNSSFDSSSILGKISNALNDDYSAVSNGFSEVPDASSSSWEDSSPAPSYDPPPASSFEEETATPTPAPSPTPVPQASQAPVQPAPPKGPPPKGDLGPSGPLAQKDLVNAGYNEHDDYLDWTINWHKFIVFSLGAEEFAIPLLSVREVIPVPETTPVPNAPTHFMGLYNLRGKVIPIIDLRKKMGIHPKQVGLEEAVIIVDVRGLNLGIIVDSINKVLTLEKKDIVQVPEIQTQLRADFIIGVYRADQDLTTILNMPKILQISELQLIKGSLALKCVA